MRYSYSLLYEVCLLRSQGHNQKAIAERLGIDRKTIYNWLSKGKKAKFGKYHDFYENWLVATAEYKKIHPPKNTYDPLKGRENIPGYKKFIKNV